MKNEPKKDIEFIKLHILRTYIINNKHVFKYVLCHNIILHLHFFQPCDKPHSVSQK